MGALGSPAVVSPPPLGSTRSLWSFMDWTTSGAGPGFGAPTYQTRYGNQSAPVKPAWSGLSGVCRLNDQLAAFLAATSFNIGEFTGFQCPVVGRAPGSVTLAPAAEEQQLLIYRFLVAQGGNPPGGNLHQPPWTGGTAVAEDVGIFFVPFDGRSSSSYAQCTDNTGSNGSEQFVGLFVSTDGLWHYGGRWHEASSPLDFDVVLTPGTKLWPLVDLTQPTQVDFRWIKSSASSDAQFQLWVQGEQIVQTTLARIGVAPTGAGLNAQLADGVSLNANDYGWTAMIRTGDGSGGSPNNVWPLSFPDIEFICGPNLTSTV